MEYNSLLGHLLVDQQVIDISDGSKDGILFTGIIGKVKVDNKNVTLYCVENRTFKHEESRHSCYHCVIPKEQVDIILSTGNVPVSFDSECEAHKEEGIYTCTIHHCLQVVQVVSKLRDWKLHYDASYVSEFMD